MFSLGRKLPAGVRRSRSAYPHRLLQTSRSAFGQLRSFYLTQASTSSNVGVCLSAAKETGSPGDATPSARAKRQ
jgi:hypothetical protein